MTIGVYDCMWEKQKVCVLLTLFLNFSLLKINLYESPEHIIKECDFQYKFFFRVDITLLTLVKNICRYTYLDYVLLLL